MWKVTHRPFQRAHSCYALDNWTSAVLSKLFLRSAVSLKNLFQVLGISKVDLLWEKYILYFQRWTWEAGACAGGTRAAGLGSPSQVNSTQTEKIQRHCQTLYTHPCAAYTLSHWEPATFSSVSANLSCLPAFKIQKWTLPLQLPFFRAKRSIYQRTLMTTSDSSANTNCMGFAVQVQMWWLMWGLCVQMHPDVSESLHMWDRIALCLHLRLRPAFRDVQHSGAKHANVIELARIQS